MAAAYDTLEAINDHINIWAVMRRAQLPAP